MDSKSKKVCEFEISYPGTGKLMDNEDMAYLQERVLSNRSACAEKVDPYNGRCYEGAKTLIDLLRFCVRAECFRQNWIRMSLTRDEKFPSASMLIRGSNKTYQPGDAIDMEVEFRYVNSNGHHDGAYFVILRGKRGGRTATWFIGTETVKNLPNPVVTEYGDDVLCFPASKMLRYSENFPTPSAFVKSIQEGVASLMLGIAGKENPKSEGE